MIIFEFFNLLFLAEIQITTEELNDLNEKLTILSENIIKFEEIDFLEKRNTKISSKIDGLEKTILGLEKEIKNLNDINNSIKDNECYSNRCPYFDENEC